MIAVQCVKKQMCLPIVVLEKSLHKMTRDAPPHSDAFIDSITTLISIRFCEISHFMEIYGKVQSNTFAPFYAGGVGWVGLLEFDWVCLQNSFIKKKKLNRYLTTMAVPIVNAKCQFKHWRQQERCTWRWPLASLELTSLENILSNRSAVTSFPSFFVLGSPLLSAPDWFHPAFPAFLSLNSPF